MKNFILILLFVFAVSFNTSAQTKEEIKPQAAAANPADVASIDSIIKAVYEVISGEAGKKRDWDRFRTLFHKDARMIPAGKNLTTGIVGARAFTPEEYITSSAPFMEKEGFFEQEIAHTADVYGNIAQVFSTYETLKKADDKKPWMRGINSFQLLNDGMRWWVLTIYWQAETPENLIPAKYLKSEKVKK